MPVKTSSLSNAVKELLGKGVDRDTIIATLKAGSFKNVPVDQIKQRYNYFSYRKSGDTTSAKGQINGNTTTIRKILEADFLPAEQRIQLALQNMGTSQPGTNKMAKKVATASPAI